jgi:hypothetical protein
MKPFAALRRIIQFEERPPNPIQQNPLFRPESCGSTTVGDEVKHQVRRFSPHQNGKVFGVLMAIGSLVFVVPIMFVASLASPAENNPPMLLMLLFPVFYLVFGYLSVVVGCWLYNVMFKYIGGIEYEAEQGNA